MTIDPVPAICSLGFIVMYIVCRVLWLSRHDSGQCGADECPYQERRRK